MKGKLKVLSVVRLKGVKVLKVTQYISMIAKMMKYDEKVHTSNAFCYFRVKDTA